MYVAEHPNVAEAVKNVTAGKLGPPEYSVAGKPLLETLNTTQDVGAQRALEMINGAGSLGAAEREITNRAKFDPYYAPAKTWFDANKAQITENAPASPGHMYEVNLNAEPHEFLHWDKPFSEQSPKVQEQIRSIVPPVPDGVTRLDTGRWVTTSGGQPVGRPDGWPDMSTAQYVLKSMREETPVQNMTGSQIHAYLAKSGPHGGSNDAAAAEALRNAGIPGIRYLDQGSRSLGPDHPDASHNHVVWTPEIMDIVRRFGIGGLIAGGGAAAAAGAQDNQ
jgi:hypothetical protein